MVFVLLNNSPRLKTLTEKRHSINIRASIWKLLSFFLFSVHLVLHKSHNKVKGLVYLNVLSLSSHGMCFQNRSHHVAINISKMLNGKRCSYGCCVKIAVLFSNKTIYMRDNFLHQIGKMAPSITCWAIYLTNIDEFISVTIAVAIMKCHPKTGPWLKGREEISTPITVKFHSLGDPSFFLRLILLSTYCVCRCWRSKWGKNIPL